jgi:hypothetical protein
MTPNGGRYSVGPTELLAELSQRGVEIAVDGDRLCYRPKEAVTPDLRAALIEHKDGLIRLLSLDDDVAWRIDAIRPQVPRTGTIPPLLARPEAKTAPRGMCVTCGELLIDGRPVRCAPCVSAIERVLNEVREGR